MSLALASSLGLCRTSVGGKPIVFKSDPFQLGVASGDPDSSSVVLWTRLAPEPLASGGGMPIEPVSVQWDIASDEKMQSIVQSGHSLATPALGHSVHVTVEGLEADRWYYYQFRCGDAVSPIGRTRTFPNRDTLPTRLKLAVTSCQNFEQGYFTGYQQMADDDPDCVVHLGDYIYEYAAGRQGTVRTHHGPEIETLDQYRSRYAQYRGDKLLRRMHAQCPWLVTLDDHEFDNNFANEISEQQGIDPVAFLVRRANAFQAYYEHMPLRIDAIPNGSDIRLYRALPYGRLANIIMLDTRQYRDDQPNGDRRSPINDDALNRSRTLLGRPQRHWLMKNLVTSSSTWNILAQQVMMGMVDRDGNPAAPSYSMDQWPGYAHERMALMEFMAQRRLRNSVVLTGDIHSSWVNELRVDDRRSDDQVIATEFVASSLSSGGNGPRVPKNHDKLLSSNPCIRYHDARRGYIRCEITPERWQSDYMVVDDVLDRGGKTAVDQSFVLQAGSPIVTPG